MGEKKKGAALSGSHSGKEKLSEEEEERKTDIFLTEVQEGKVRSACRGGVKGWKDSQNVLLFKIRPIGLEKLTPSCNTNNFPSKKPNSKSASTQRN